MEVQGRAMIITDEFNRKGERTLPYFLWDLKKCLSKHF